MLFRKIPRVAESITADQIMARRFAENMYVPHAQS